MKLSITITAILMMLVMQGEASTAEAKTGKPPNVLLILVDDMGYSDPGCYGGEIQTPVIDSLHPIQPEGRKRL